METTNVIERPGISLARTAPYLSLALGVALIVVTVKFWRFHIEHPRVFYFILFPIIAHIIHQFEEWAQPGGFWRFFNGIVSDGRLEEEPLTPAMGAVINSLLFPLFLGVSGLIGLRYPWIGVASVFVVYANAFFHITYGLTRMKYNPGLITAFFIMLPLGMSVAYVFSANGDLTQMELVLAILAGTLMSGMPFPHGRHLVKGLSKVEAA